MLKTGKKPFNKLRFFAHDKLPKKHNKHKFKWKFIDIGYFVNFNEISIKGIEFENIEFIVE
jgi:hypothetical protein